MKRNVWAKKLSAFLILALFVVALPLNVAHADDHNIPEEGEVHEAFEQICGAEQNLFEKIQDIDLDVRRTITNSLTATFTSGMMQAATGGTTEAVLKCVAFLEQDTSVLSELNPNITTEEFPETCTLSEEEADFCEALFLTYDTESSAEITNRPIRTGGSLATVTERVYSSTSEAPPPVNLAYFVERQAEDVPFVGPALAQSPGEAYRAPFMEVTYTLWAAVRNVALILISLSMIVTGVLIMTRKRLNPQTTVTVQYAIPRIVIAIVLIIFSYPIGAAMAVLAWGLRSATENLVYSAIGLTNAEQVMVNLSFLAVIVAGYGAFIILTLGSGVFVAIIGVLGLLVALIVRLIVAIKIFYVYLKMLVWIIGAPLVFVVGSVPGNEKQTINWFKKMGVLLLSIFGMQAIVTATHIVLALIVMNTFEQLFEPLTFDAVASAAGMIILGPLLIPLVLVFGYYQAMRLPGRLDKALLGKKY